MKFESVDKWLSAIKDYHIPACLFMFVIGAVLQATHHMDMSFVAFTGTIAAAITGQAYSPAWRDNAPQNSNDPAKGGSNG